MVTVKTKSFGQLKDLLLNATVSPDRFKPDKFHTLNREGNKVKRIAMIVAAGRITILYDAKASDDITLEDSWFIDSIEVLDVGENVK